jgi:hypothetical protein
MGAGEISASEATGREEPEVKQLVADLSLDKLMLQDVLSKKFGETLKAFASAMIASQRSKSEIPAWLVRCQQQGNWRLGAGRFPAELRRFEPLPTKNFNRRPGWGLSRFATRRAKKWRGLSRVQHMQI